MDLLGTLAPPPGLDKDGKADPFAPLGTTPWSRGINQVAIDAGIAGAGGVPSKLSPQQMAIATLVDPAYQAHQVLVDPRTSAQATRDRWDALRNGDLGKVGSAYWNDPGTALAQDVHTLLTQGNSATAQVMRALDRTPLGYVVPYAAAATGNIIGGAAHTVVDEAKRWGPAVLAAVTPGGSYLARAAGIDVYGQARSDYQRDPVGTAVEDGTSVLAIASGGAGAAARAGSSARAGAGEVAASDVARSQAGRSPFSATKNFAQSGWTHLKNFITGDTPKAATPRPGPGTPHRDDVGKPDRYRPPDEPADAGSGKTGPERSNLSITDQPSAVNGLNKFPWTSWQGYPKTSVNGQEYARIGDHLYTQHAVDRMQPSGLGAPAGASGPGRSISPTFTEHILKTTKGIAEKVDGENRLVRENGSLRIITSEDDRLVITVMRIRGK